MNEAMTPKQIVEQIQFEQRINTNQFAKSIGVTPTNVYDLMSGKIRTITNDMADKIRKVYPNYSKAWLLTGEGEPHVQEQVEKQGDDDADVPGIHMPNFNDAKTTGDIVKICNMFIGEIAAQREMYGGQISKLIALIDKHLSKDDNE